VIRVVVGEADPKLSVDLCFVCRGGVAQGVQQATERVHHRVDVVSAEPLVHAVVTGEVGQSCLRDRALLLHFLAPCHYQYGIGACFQGCSMTGELAFALGDRSLRRLNGGSVVRLCVFQRRQGLLDPRGVECLCQPRV
jgi:hypothetical protein